MPDPLYAQAKQLFPNASDEEIEQGLAQVREQAPAASDQELLASAGKIQASMNDGSFMKQMVNHDIKQKYGLADRQKIVDQNAQEASGPNWQAGLAALGAGLQGGNALQAGMSVAKQQEDTRKGRLAEFDKQKSQYLSDRDDAAAQEKLKREMDPNSYESQLARDTAIDFGISPERAKGLTAARLKEISPLLAKKFELKEKSLDRQERRADRRESQLSREFERDKKAEEKLLEFKTPYGLANTSDDAKKLKEAHESKASFDSKIQEMIELRQKYGGEMMNREAVARGKQLAKDLLLEYKNMAKLGVLSKSDESIVNAIIPEDPLAFSAAGVLGQDPILHTLKKFKQDSDKDFSTRVATRTREGSPQGFKSSGVAAAPASVRMRAPNGKIKMIPGDQVSAAKKAGAVVVDEAVAQKENEDLNGV